jgi:sugar phosphate isomerase/epimerase
MSPSRRGWMMMMTAGGSAGFDPGLLGDTLFAQQPAGRKMTLCLSTGMLGAKASLAESVRLAAQFGFEAVEPSLGPLTAMTEGEIDRLRAEVESRHLAIGAPGTGVPVGQSQEAFASWLAGLPKTAKALQRVGGRRIVTWVLSTDAALPYRDNFKLHARRFAEVAGVLGDHNLRLGLEYLGPKTIWASQRFPFLHTMREMKELIAEIGKPNVGFLLDSWHWYTAQETTAELLTLRNEDVAGVHLNDAPKGIPVDQQIDNRRGLPASTGVIDVGGFLGALNQIGYDGPVAAEPFDSSLRELPVEQAVGRAADAMKKAFAQMRRV